MSEFLEFPKMARLSRECIISEKIDGTNGQILIESFENAELEQRVIDTSQALLVTSDFALFAGSRTRWVTLQNDNYGFARWVYTNAEQLLQLGPGRHFGEWWGNGIQRRYDQMQKNFSLFNTIRWVEYGQTPQIRSDGGPNALEPVYQEVLPEILRLTPVLYRGMFSTEIADIILQDLKKEGSRAAPGFMNPEGIVVYHIAGGVGFKKTIEKDELPKTLAERKTLKAVG